MNDCISIRAIKHIIKHHSDKFPKSANFRYRSHNLVEVFWSHSASHGKIEHIIGFSSTTGALKYVACND